MNTQIQQKAIQVNGKELMVKILKIGDQEGWTTQQAAEYLGLTHDGLRSTARDAGVKGVRLTPTQVKSLKDIGAVPIRMSHSNFWDKDSIQQLVKIVNTEEAWAIYNQLWVTAEASLNPTQTAFEFFRDNPTLIIRGLCDQLDEARAQLKVAKQTIQKTNLRLINAENQIDIVSGERDKSSIDAERRKILYQAVFDRASKHSEPSKAIMAIFKMIKDSYKISKSMFLRNDQFEDCMELIKTCVIVGTDYLIAITAEDGKGLK